MPFSSRAQQRFMHAEHPRIAARWDKETDFSRLPEHAEKKAVWDGFVAEMLKHAGVPDGEPAPRTRVTGLKTPRIATPRLNPELGSKIPSNPFRGNWQKLAHDLTHHEQIALGLAALGAGAYTLKRTGEELRNPRPSGVGAGAGARTVQRVLLPGTSRAQVAPQIYGSY